VVYDKKGSRSFLLQKRNGSSVPFSHFLLFFSLFFSDFLPIF